MNYSLYNRLFIFLDAQVPKNIPNPMIYGLGLEQYSPKDVEIDFF